MCVVETGHIVPNCYCHSTLWRKPTDGVRSKCSDTHDVMEEVMAMEAVVVEEVLWRQGR